MTARIARGVAWGLAPIALAGWVPPAAAALMVSKVIVDLPADAPPRDDIELWNDGNERLYVVVRPGEVVEPGLPGEHRVDSVDPSVTGLLTTPQKLVLDPGERRIVRVALVAPRSARERIYRLMIKPVSGTVTASRTGLKVYVGYDVLMIVRPTMIAGEITAIRTGRQVVVHNGTNSSVELVDGQQCEAKGCTPLPSRRLYAGADWTLPVETTAPVRFQSLGVRGAKRPVASN